MSKHLHLTKRGETWVIRRRVPANIVDAVGKKEVWRTLGTKDKSVAVRRYPATLEALEREFEIATSRSDSTKPVSLEKFDVRWEARQWFIQENQELELNDTAEFNSNQEKEEVIQELSQELDDYKSRNIHRYGSTIQSYADKILILKGYPSKPLQKGSPRQLRSASKQAHVDKNGPEYRQFCELIRKGLVELTEKKLLLLGEKIERTESIDIFKPNFSIGVSDKNERNGQVGLSVENLIEEYFERADNTRDPKTIADKKAAFRFLTETVGPNFLVENLKRSHFVAIRKLLSKYPTNARKLNRTKNMSMDEIVDDAKKNNRKIMSHKNANKILARLKSLEQFAVDEGHHPSNLANGLTFSRPSEGQQDIKKAPFNLRQLKAIISSPEFIEHKKANDPIYWATLIALFHGMRMEEILQLKVHDIHTDPNTGVMYFDIHDKGENSLKNKNSVRRVPIHPMMIKLGFIKYLKTRKASKDQSLLIGLTRGQGMDKSYRKNFSKRYTRFLKKIDVHTKETTFHSFRHNFATEATSCAVTEDLTNALCGWGLKSGHSGTYVKAKDIALETLYAEISKVMYKGLDLSDL